MAPGTLSSRLGLLASLAFCCSGVESGLCDEATVAAERIRLDQSHQIEPQDSLSLGGHELQDAESDLWGVQEHSKDARTKFAAVLEEDKTWSCVQNYATFSGYKGEHTFCADATGECFRPWKLVCNNWQEGQHIQTLYFYAGPIDFYKGSESQKLVVYFGERAIGLYEEFFFHDAKLLEPIDSSREWITGLHEFDLDSLSEMPEYSKEQAGRILEEFSTKNRNKIDFAVGQVRSKKAADQAALERSRFRKIYNELTTDSNVAYSTSVERFFLHKGSALSCKEGSSSDPLRVGKYDLACWATNSPDDCNFVRGTEYLDGYTNLRGLFDEVALCVNSLELEEIRQQDTGGDYPDTGEAKWDTGEAY